MKTVNICGMRHEVVLASDTFDSDGTHFGQIDFGRCRITLNSNLPKDLAEATLCHEIMHGILTHIGRENLSNDETFVTALGNAVNQSFRAKLEESNG